MRHSDSAQGWIKREFKEIRRQMREDRAARKLQAATIGKGGITVKDGGAIKTEYTNGTTAAYFGPVYSDRPSASVSLADGNGTALFTAISALASDAGPAFSYFQAGGDTVDVLTMDQAAWIHLGASQVNLMANSGVTIQYTNTAAAANCFIDPSDGRIWRSTSSRRRKVDIEDAEVDPAVVLQMQGRTFRDKGQVEADPDTDKRYVGFIAEELHDLGLTQFVDYDDDGQPDAIAYDRLSVALLAVLKDQERRIKALEADETPADP